MSSMWSIKWSDHEFFTLIFYQTPARAVFV